MGLAAFNRMRRLQAEKEAANKKAEINPHLEGLTVAELKDIAKQEGIEKYSNLNKGELLKALKDYEPKSEE